LESKSVTRIDREHVVENPVPMVDVKVVVSVVDEVWSRVDTERFVDVLVTSKVDVVTTSKNVVATGVSVIVVVLLLENVAVGIVLVAVTVVVLLEE